MGVMSEKSGRFIALLASVALLVLCVVPMAAFATEGESEEGASSAAIRDTSDPDEGGNFGTSVSAIEYKVADGKSYTLVEGVDCWENEVYDEDDNPTGETWLCYKLPDANADAWETYFFDGDELVLNYEDGTSKSYYFSRDKLRFLDEQGNRYAGYLETSSDQSPSAQWGRGEHAFTLSYGGQSCTVPVEVVSNPVESISYEPAGTIKLIEGEDCFNCVTTVGEGTADEHDVEWCEYWKYPLFLKGDRLNVKMTDGQTVSYMLNMERDEDGDPVCWFVNEADASDVVGLDDILISSDQSVDNQWGLGEHAFTMKYMARTCAVPVKIVEAGACEHVWGEGVVTVEPTCTNDGERTFTCAECDETRTEKIDNLGHALEHVDAKAATCTAVGNAEYWKCSRCGKCFLDAAGTAEVDPDATVVAALGHDYRDTVVAPTCTEGGYTLHECSRCGDSYKDAQTAALGHSWDKGKVTKAATYDNKGVRTYTCTKCGKTRTQDIAKLTRTSLSNATITLPAKAYTYTGKVIKPVPTVKIGKKTLKAGTDYTVSYKANKVVGNATVTVTAAKNKSGKLTGAYTGSKSKTFTIKQATNKVTVAKYSVSKKLTAATAKKKAVSYSLPKATTKFGKAKWVVSTKDKKGVLSLSGTKVKVKKGAKKGTYTIKLKAQVAGTKNYKAASSKAVTVTVKIS